MPKYYYTGSRKAQVLHTRLRTNCSSLNMDLFLKNISDSPLCRCGSLENAQHFFFHCPYFQDQRNELLNAVLQFQTPSLSLLLYGDISLSLEINKQYLKMFKGLLLRQNIFNERLHIHDCVCDVRILLVELFCSLAPLSHLISLLNRISAISQVNFLSFNLVCRFALLV